MSPVEPRTIQNLERDLAGRITGEIRFDVISRALYSTDASVYQIQPGGVVLPRSREDVIRIVQICATHGIPITMRGGGTSQGGQAIGHGLIVDTSKYLNRLLEVNVAERWARVEPGIVLDDLNAQLKAHNLRFAPDISTASRATVGGMMANNSSGARSVLYGKTIDHVIEQDVVLSDGTVTTFRALDGAELERKCAEPSLEGECYRTVRALSRELADEIDRRYPKVVRRVGGYNLDEFTDPRKPFNLSKLMVGSEGTLGVVLEAKINLVELPKHKSVLAIQFKSLLESLAATPVILQHKPSAIEVMDKFILDHTKQSPRLQALRETFIEGEPGALLCVEFYAENAGELAPRMQAVEKHLREAGYGYRFHHALDAPGQASIWSLREAALGLSMAMKDDNKSLSFVEDTAVAPEKLRDYIERFMQIIERHDTRAGVYAHASVGCLHVRPVVNMKTAEGVQKFESIANAVADLALEFGASLSGEHGDGYVRSPFMEKMFGPALYEAFRTVKRTFDPNGLFNPGKIVDAPPMTTNLRYGAGYVSPQPMTFFDYSDYGGMSGAVEMCSGLGACRKKLEGTMCPSYMATKEEADSTRGRANVLRLAMAGKLGESGLGDDGVYEVLDLCLECRACKAECPVGVDMARFKSEFLADYWARHGTSMHARALGNARMLAQIGSAMAPISNWAIDTRLAKWINERFLGIDRRRALPHFSKRRVEDFAPRVDDRCDAVLFNDTFTNYYEPQIGAAALSVLRAAGVRTGIAEHGCCGRPQISKGLLADARSLAERNARDLFPHAAAGRKIVFCEPSCLSAVREDAPSLVRPEFREQAEMVAKATVLFEEFMEPRMGSLPLGPGPSEILLHGHCHQKSMGLLSAAKSMLSKVKGSTVIDLDAGCCGMAGSFGYAKEHFEVSRAIGERKLLPAVRNRKPDSAVVAAGTSCRHQVKDFTGETAVHPAVFLQSLLMGSDR